MTALLQVRAVSRRFGGLQALDTVSFDVEKGGTVGIIGANGAGKTTLFGVISGTVRPDTGEVLLEGNNVTAQSPSRRCAAGIGRTFQITRPFPDLTVLETIRVGCLLHTRSMREATRRAEEIVGRFGLRAHVHKQGRQLAVMDRKRLEIARAYATQPRLLLLDEVAAGLRPGEVDHLVELIASVAAEGVTVVMIEHVLAAIFALARRVLVLDHGQLIAEGTPDEVKVHPKVVEAYLGAGYAAA
jgi:branched-chain amino acid transport system ATP-binding protein